MKKFLKWAGIIISIPFALLIILSILIYIPPIQNFAVRKAASMASEATGMDISVGKITLSFPLNLNIHNVSAVEHNDTILNAGQITLKIQMRPLLKKQVEIDAFGLKDISLNTKDMIEGITLNGQLGELYLESHGIALSPETAIINEIRIKNTDLDVCLADTAATDTTASAPLYWKIMLQKAEIDNVAVQLEMPLDSMSMKLRLGSALLAGGMVDLNKEEYSLKTFSIGNSTAEYITGSADSIVTEGFNPSNILLSDINIEVDSVYYCGNSIRANIKDLRMKESCGTDKSAKQMDKSAKPMEILSAKGKINMNDEGMNISGLELKTTDSYITMQAGAGLNISQLINWQSQLTNQGSEIENDGNISARLMADIGKNDLFRFMTGMPEDFRRDFPSLPLQVRAGIDGTVNAIRITAISVEIPEHIRLSADGYANDVMDSTKMCAHIDMKADFPNMKFAKSLLGTTSIDSVGFTIPADMTINGTADIKSDSIITSIRLLQGEGSMELKAGYMPKNEGYFAGIDIKDLNMHNFMPGDSLFMVSASVKASGNGFAFMSPKCKMEAEAGISNLEYTKYRLSGISMNAKLENSEAKAQIEINDNLMDISSTLNASISTKELKNRQSQLINRQSQIIAAIKTDIKRLDLHAMGVSPEPFKTAETISIEAQTDMSQKHSAKVKINNIKLITPKKTFSTKDINFGATITKDSLRSYINSGDMTMLLRTTGGIDQISDRITKITSAVEKQWENRRINLDSIRSMLPETTFRIFAGDDNPFVNTLEMGGIGISKMYASFSTSATTGIESKAYLYGLQTDSLRLDTISFRAVQDSTGIVLTGGVKAEKTKKQEAFSISLDGGIYDDNCKIGEANANLMIKYDNEKGETGALIGLKSVLRKRGISLHVLPENPILVYRKFNLNPDNYIFLADKGRIMADMRLFDNNGTGLQIYSVTDSTSLQDITVAINRLDIGEFKRIIPYMPPIEGIINAEAHYVQQDEESFMTALETGIESLAYAGAPLGDWTMSGVYLPTDNGGHHADGFITRNGNTLAEINGQYKAAGKKEEQDNINAHLDIRRFPLELAGAFVPEDLALLRGYASADVSISGSTSSPVINGSMLTDSVNVFIPMTSMSLRFENKPITVKDNKLMFNKYSIYSRGQNPYIIDGTVDFADMANMQMDLMMTARNFEVFNSKKNRTSMVYGKMYIDLNTSIKGTPDAISVRGNANILGSSDFTYILRESPLTVEDRLAETVTFVNFADTAAARRKPLQEIRPGGIDMLMNLNIDQAVQCKVDINESGSNYMRVEGGGNLAFQYTPDGNMLLNGRYQLMSGEMKYEMPVIPLKTFRIREGSYIEWTGNVMDPRLDIQAYERTRTSVTQEGQAARMVAFDVGVSITNRLSDLGFAFTLDAPEDGSMQNELAAMSASQKNKAAVTMLVTGMYISDSSTAKLDANSALNSYLQGQINNIAGNALKTIDLSVGMETTNATETGDQRTDYNFQFAKRFWNNRVRVVIGGKISTGNAAVRDESFIDNISLEYRLDNSGTRYVKLFHDKKYANVLEGEVTETGAGIVLKKKVARIKDLFIFQRKKKKETVETK